MKTIAIYLIMCLSCLSVRAQKCDSTSLSKDSSLLVKTAKIEKATPKNLLKKNSKTKTIDNKYLGKYVNLADTCNTGMKIKTNSAPPKFRKENNNKNENYWTDFISNIFFR